MSSKDYCKQIDGDNYVIKLSFQKELEEAMEKAKKNNKPLILMGPRFSGKTTALKMIVSKGVIRNDVPIIEISKDKIDENKREELKKLIAGDGFRIIEATKYQIKYVLSDESYQASNDESKLKEFLKKIFKSKAEELKLPEGVIKVEANITEEEVDKIFECYIEEYLKKHGDKIKISKSELINKKDHFIEMAYLGKKSKGIFIPQYLKRLIENHADKREEELRLLKEREKEIEDVLLGFFGISLIDLVGNSSNVVNLLEAILPYLRGAIQKGLNLFLGPANVVIAGLSLLFAFYGRDIEGGYDSYIEAYRYWNEMPQEKREALCSVLDEKFNLPPGSSCEFLSSWLSKDEVEMRRRLKKILSKEFLEKLEEIVNQNEELKRAVEEQQREIERIKSEIRKINEELEKLREEFYSSGTIRVKSERELSEMFYHIYSVDIKEETIVGIGESGQDKVVKNKALEIINKASNKLVLIVGEPGVGKSTLLYIIGRELLKQGKRVYLVDDIGKFGFSDFLKLGDDAYAILDIARMDPNRALDRILETSYAARVIIAIRSSFVKDSKYSKKLEEEKDIVEIYNMSMETNVLLEIAKRNLSSIKTLTKEQVEQLASKLVEKSEGLPLYITEAVKKISSEIGQKNVDEILNSLPKGIKALILNIIDSEMNRSSHLLLLYYLVSHYPNFPEELISSAKTLFDISRPLYMDELLEEGVFTLHSWYKDITDLIYQGKFDELDFGEEKETEKQSKEDKMSNKMREFINKVKEAKNSKFLKEKANDYIESIKETLLRKNLIFGELNKRIFDFINHLPSTVPLINLTDAVMLFLIFDAVKANLVNKDTEYGFMIDREIVDPTKLNEDGYQFYNKLVGFLINTYLKDLNEDESLNRPFYALSTLYIGRLLTGDLAKRIDEEFLGEKDPKLTIYEIAFTYAYSSKLLRLYISALVSLLESIGYKGIKPLCNSRKDLIPVCKFEEGLLLYCKGKYEDAIKELDEAIRGDPHISLYHYFKAIVLYELRQYKKALDELDIAIKLDPNIPFYHINRAQVLERLGLFKEAVKEYEEYGQIIKPDPNNPEYHNNKGVMLEKLEQYEEAIEEFDNAIKLDPNNPLYHSNKAHALAKLNRFDEAIKEYDIAIRLEPNNPDYHGDKGDLLLELKQYEKALEEFDIAIRLDPNEPGYHNNKGVALLGLGRFEEALEEFTKAIKLDPNEPSYHGNRATVLLVLGRYEEAVKGFDEAIELNPNNPAYHYSKAVALKKLNRFDEAIKSMEIALSLLPGEPSYLVLYAELWADLDLSKEEIIRKIRDSIASSKTDKNELCKEIDKELGEEGLNEKEKKMLSHIKNEICTHTAIRLDSNTSKYHYNKGLSLVKLRRYKEAIEEFNKAIRLDPNNPEYHHSKALTLIMLKQFEDALKEFDEAIRLDPNNPSYHFNKGNLLRELRRFEEALEEFNKAIKLDPNNLKYHGGKALALLELKRFDEAIKEFDELIRLNPKDPVSHSGKALALLELKRYEKALEEFDEAIKLDPNSPEYHNYKGTVLAALGRYREAIEEFDIAIRLEPNKPEYHYGKALALKELNRLEDAIKEFDIAIRLNPNNPEYHNGKALALEKLGRYEEAIKEYEEAIRLDPNKPEYRNNKGIVLLTLRRFNEAVKEFDIAIKLNPNNPFYHSNKAVALMELNRFDEAIKELDEAIRLDPKDPRYHFNKGNVLERLRRFKDAIKEFDEAIELDPNNPEYHYSKARALEKLGLYKDAIKEYDVAIELDPKNLHYHNSKALLLFRLNMFEDAIKEFDIAIRLNPNNPFYHSNKAVALMELNRFDEAIKELDEAIELDPNNPFYHSNKGTVLKELGLYEDAIKEFDIAIRLDPNNPYYHYGKGHALFMLKRYDEAIKELDKAIELDPNNPDYHILYAELEADLGSQEKGINKIKDLVTSGLVNKNELCEKIDRELKEVRLNEREKSTLMKIKITIC